MDDAPDARGDAFCADGRPRQFARSICVVDMADACDAIYVQFGGHSEEDW